MITTPNRLAELTRKLASGQSISADELRRTEMLICLDIAQAGREFAEQAVIRNEQEDEKCLRLLESMVRTEK